MRKLFTLLAFCVFICSMESRAADKMLVFIGTYTGGGSEGIYAFEFSLADGALKPLGLAAETPNPSFLALHPNGKFLYAVNEVSRFKGEETGSVSAFAIEGSTGKLRHLNTRSSAGPGPCHVTAGPDGRNVLIANYGGGSVTVLPIAPDGSLRPASCSVQHQGSSVNPQRQKEPHAHSINLDPKNRFAIAADLGIDKLLVYRFDPETGKIEPNDPSSTSARPGAGPRHFAFHPDGRHAYVINELDMTVTVLDYDPEQGTLIPVQTISTLPPGVQGDDFSTAEVQVHPSGKFVYGSNRGHDSIVVYKADPATGKLTYIENESTQGQTPRHFGIDPTGRFLIAANQNSDSLVVFRIDPESGELEPAGVRAEAPNPVCVKFLPLL